MRICLYCPDRHLTYDGTTADQVGVGGGVTARIRLAAALARAGHEMTVVCNAPAERTVDDVRYVPLDASYSASADVLVITTSGGGLDLGPAFDLEIDARLRVVWVHGVKEPQRLKELPHDYVYSVSNFIRRVARKEWDLPGERIFVSHNGVVRSPPKRGLRRLPARDMHRLAYTSHPAKGLAPAKEVLRILRERDPGFELHVFGSEALWGRKERRVVDEPGVVHHGLVGQPQLIEGLRQGGFLINIQEIEDAFALAPAEAMAEGCIVIASPRGGYPELIRSGYNGFLIEGDHLARTTHEQVADLVFRLTNDADHAGFIRRNGLSWPLDWDTLARAWTGHWRWALDGARTPGPIPGIAGCPSCGGAVLALADGYHCTSCGYYTRDGLDADTT